MIKKIQLILFILFINFIFAQKIDYSVSSIPDNLKENANSCIRFQSINIEIKSQKKYLITTQKIITIFNKNGIGNIHAQEYFNNSNRINTIQATIYNSLGVLIKKVKQNEFENQSVADGFSIYTDNRILFLDYTPTEFPFTIVYDSEIESSNTAFIPRWSPIDHFYQSVQKSTFSITYPTDLGFKFKEFNFDNKTINKEESKNKLSYIIENILPEKPEEFSSILKNSLPNVLFGLEKFSLEGVDGFAKNWKDFGLWINTNLLSNTDELSVETQNKIKTLVANETDVFKKAKIIYNYVQNKTRYVSIQMGIGGWKPMLAKDVDRLGYGDCKALSNYTQALLKTVNIPSYYTIVYAGGKKQNIEEDLVSMQGNHVILTLPIDNKLHFLECTSQTIPFDFEGDFTDDRKVLIIKPDGGEIVNTTVYTEKNNTQNSKGSCTILNDGSIQCSIEIKSRGIQYNNEYNVESESESELQIHFKQKFSWINNLKLEKPKFINNKNDIEFIELLKFSAEGFGQFSSNLMIVPINVFNRDNSIPQRYRNRKNSFEIERGFTDYDEIEITIPSDFVIDAKPENLVISEKFGQYNFEIIAINEAKLIYKRTLIINKGEWDKKEYENYRIFKEQISKADNSKIVLIKK